MTVSWRDLIVTDAEGDTAGTLGWFVDHAPANLDNAVIEGGVLKIWDGYFISAEGEDPNFDTPKVPVDWSGFQTAIEEVYQVVE